MSAPAASSFHSRYDPYREAERFLDDALGGREPSVVFILGGGMNYLGSALAARLPRAERVLLQVDASFDGTEVDVPPRRWSPSSAEPLASVIGAALAGGRMAGGVSVLEWRPVLSAFPERAAAMKAELLALLDTYSSDAATSAYWARRWLTNCVRAAVGSSRLARITKGSSAIVVACAGPGLEASLPELARVRDSVALWALSSAHACLSARGLRPDLVVTSDPGLWNGYHLAEAVRSGIPVAMPPSAYAMGECFDSCAVAALDTGLSFERAAIRAMGTSPIRVPASGSASGTAISLALASTSGPVLVLGLDYASLGMRDHASPYAFDALSRARESRLSRGEDYARVAEAYPEPSGAWRLSRAFSSYARTTMVEAADAGRVFRLSGSPVPTGLRSGDFSSIAGAGAEAPSVIESRHGGTQAERRRTLKVGLDELLYAAEAAARDSLESGEALGYESALTLKALAPKEAAAFIARAARGGADARMLLDAFNAARVRLELHVKA